MPVANLTNCQILYTAIVEMLIYWIAYMNPPSKEEAQEIIDKRVNQSKVITYDILRG